jgi:hypothetical protein
MDLTIGYNGELHSLTQAVMQRIYKFHNMKRGNFSLFNYYQLKKKFIIFENAPQFLPATLGFTQALTEMSTKDRHTKYFCGVERGLFREADNLTAICEPIV